MRKNELVVGLALAFISLAAFAVIDAVPIPYVVETVAMAVVAFAFGWGSVMAAEAAFLEKVPRGAE